jgi:hypothetical protein
MTVRVHIRVFIDEFVLICWYQCLMLGIVEGFVIVWQAFAVGSIDSLNAKQYSKPTEKMLLYMTDCMLWRAPIETSSCGIWSIFLGGSLVQSLNKVTTDTMTTGWTFAELDWL